MTRWWRSKNPYRSPFTVVSVGNLTVGGTGKSVAVHYFLTLFGEEKCAVVMRGYGGRAAQQKKPTCVAAKGEVFVSVAESGDEAYALALRTKALVVVGGDKRASVAWCAEQKKQKITHIILDDGYQSWGVARDFNVVLIDGRSPLGNGHCLPLGPLRETDLGRATCVLVTHAKGFSADKKEKIRLRLQPFSKKELPFLWSSHEPTGVFKQNKLSKRIDAKKQKDVVVVAGIGKPEGVVETVMALGMQVTQKCFFPDHHSYTRTEVEEVEKVAAGRQVITTEKDWVKITALFDQEVALEVPSWLVVRIELQCDPQETSFFSKP